LAEGVGSDDGNSAMMNSGYTGEGAEVSGCNGNAISNRYDDISDSVLAAGDNGDA
jgi:hypothetical protein